jgi:hypothetical protein
MKVWEFEDKVWEIDRIRIVVRAPTTADVSDYTKTNAANEGISIAKYLETRIEPCIGRFEVTVLSGDGEFLNKKSHVGTVRQSYSK